MNRLFAVPALRQRYIAHIKTILDEAMNTQTTNALLDKYYNQIDSIVAKDPKKATTYAAFKPGVETLKKFVADRKTFILNNAELKAYNPPTISNSAFYVNNEKDRKPESTEEVIVKVTVTSTNGISSVQLYYGTGLTGTFTKTTMFDDATNGDETANDGIFTGKIPAQKGGEWVRYYIESIAANASKSVSYLPVGAEHSIFVYQVKNKASLLGEVVINEIMASNSKTAQDENGKNEDWIEFYNRSNQPVDISDYVLTDNTANLNKWFFAKGTIIPANGFYIVWADEDSKDKPNHCNFKLSSAGETLWLLNKTGQLQDSITFGVQITDQSLSRLPNGTGNFTIKAPTFNVSNEKTVNVGIEDEAISPVAMKLIPNPARDFVQILFEGESQQAVFVYNSYGQLMQKIDFQQDIRLETSQYSAGIYVVKCGKWMKKLVVTK
jgi:hypothetical protein